MILFLSRNLQKFGAFESEIIEFLTSMFMLCLSRKGIRVTIYAKKMILMGGKYFNLRSPKLQSFFTAVVRPYSIMLTLTLRNIFFSTGIGILLTLTLSCPFKLEAALWSLGKRVRKYISRKKPTSQRYLSLRISPFFSDFTSSRWIIMRLVLLNLTRRISVSWTLIGFF